MLLGPLFASFVRISYSHFFKVFWVFFSLKQVYELNHISESQSMLFPLSDSVRLYVGSEYRSLHVLSLFFLWYTDWKLVNDSVAAV